MGTQLVSENNCAFHRQISWLVNHEMLLLSIAASLAFCIKYILLIEGWKCYHFISIIISKALCIFVYLLSESSYDYDKLCLLPISPTI